MLINYLVLPRGVWAFTQHHFCKIAWKIPLCIFISQLSDIINTLNVLWEKTRREILSSKHRRLLTALTLWLKCKRAQEGDWLVKRAALSPGDLWLFEGINKAPEGKEAGGTARWHIMGHALITVKPNRKEWVKFWGWWRLTSTWWGRHCRVKHEGLTLELKFLLIFSEIVMFTWNCWGSVFIITPCRTQRRIPECVKAVTISKNRNNAGEGFISTFVSGQRSLNVCA